MVLGIKILWQVFGPIKLYSGDGEGGGDGDASKPDPVKNAVEPKKTTTDAEIDAALDREIEAAIDVHESEGIEAQINSDNDAVEAISSQISAGIQALSDLDLEIETKLEETIAATEDAALDAEIEDGVDEHIAGITVNEQTSDGITTRLEADGVTYTFDPETGEFKGTYTQDTMLGLSEETVEFGGDIEYDYSYNYTQGYFTDTFTWHTGDLSTTTTSAGTEEVMGTSLNDILDSTIGDWTYTSDTHYYPVEHPRAGDEYGMMAELAADIRESWFGDTLSIETAETLDKIGTVAVLGINAFITIGGFAALQAVEAARKAGYLTNAQALTYLGFTGVQTFNTIKTMEEYDRIINNGKKYSDAASAMDVADWLTFESDVTNNPSAYTNLATSVQVDDPYLASIITKGIAMLPEEVTDAYDPFLESTEFFFGGEYYSADQVGHELFVPGEFTNPDTWEEMKLNLSKDRKAHIYGSNRELEYVINTNLHLKGLRS